MWREFSGWYYASQLITYVGCVVEKQLKSAHINTLLCLLCMMQWITKNAATTEIQTLTDKKFQVKYRWRNKSLSSILFGVGGSEMGRAECIFLRQFKERLAIVFIWGQWLQRVNHFDSINIWATSSAIYEQIVAKGKDASYQTLFTEKMSCKAVLQLRCRSYVK